MIKLLTICITLITTAFADNQFINSYVFNWGEKNPEIVEKYLRSSIQFDKQKSAVAAYVLGNLYLSGTFLKKDLRKADLYITMAANLGLPEAINSIGDGYYSGDIRKKDVRQALAYYEKAAKLGFGAAQFNAGIVLLRYGKTKKDLQKSILYLDKASKNFHDLNSITKFAQKYKEDAKIKYERGFNN